MSGNDSLKEPPFMPSTNVGEEGYLQLVKHVLKNGVLRTNRTGVKTLSVFGSQLRFDLSEQKLPLLTTKKMSFETIATELVFFLSGNTNQEAMEEMGCKIWKANTTREFLDSRQLYHYTPNQTLGPIYGFQWRHYNAIYRGTEEDYTGKGVDQLARVINMIITDPDSRRIIMTAWNPEQIDQMVLPPCHVMVHFIVDKIKKTLSAHVFQRSADLMLGVPFNIASYGLLTHLIADMCRLKAAELVHTMSDTHIYVNHIRGAEMQILRVPLDPPKCKVTLTRSGEVRECDKMSPKQFTLLKYKSHSAIDYPMSV